MEDLSFMVSPLTNTIYMAKTKPLEKEGQFVVIGDKIDVTDNVIRVVFEWFMKECENGTIHEVTFGSKFGKLTYTPSPILENIK